MARTFKKLGEFKPNQSASEDKGAIVTGKVDVINNNLVLVLPLDVTEDMCRIFEEDVERNGKTEIVPKGNLVVSFEIPEGLELTVDGLTFKVKRGGMAAKRYFTLGFDPRNGYKRVPIPADENTTDNNADDDADEVIENTESMAAGQ